MQKSKIVRGRERKAVTIALIAAFVTVWIAAGAVKMWDKPRSWVPILVGIAIGILAYVLIAPEA